MLHKERQKRRRFPQNGKDSYGMTNTATGSIGFMHKLSGFFIFVPLIRIFLKQLISGEK